MSLLDTWVTMVRHGSLITLMAMVVGNFRG